MSESGLASPWIAPEFSPSGGKGLMTADKLEALQRAAYDEAYANGFAEGRQAARAELEQQLSRFNALMNGLAQPFEELDEEVEVALMDLAVRIAGQLVCREVSVEPQLIIGVIQQAIAALPAASRSVEVHLNPEDSALLTQMYVETEQPLPWTLVDDASLTRGGLRVISAASRIDASVEQRLQTIFDTLLSEHLPTDV